VNVDGFVAAQNLARFEETDDLDVAYLAQLTPDAYPVISERLGSVDGLAPSELRAQLACKAGILNAELPGRSWQSFHVGRQRASDALASLSDDLSGHQVWMEDAAWYVADPDGEEFPCLGMWQD
jgi:hypothetical protein